MVDVNRREKIRFKAKKEIKVLLKHNNKFYYGLLYDITIGGIGISIPNILKINKEDTVDFKIIGMGGVIRKAKVERSEERKIGLSFDTDEENKHIIKEFLNNYMYLLEV